jgi:CheY-like chemotaxis protein
LHNVPRGEHVVYSKHILVVDDEVAMRDTIARVLREEGYAVSTASNGAEALVELQDRRPDGIILDLHMPEFDGDGFLRLCRTQPAYASVPIALCSSSTRISEVARAFDVKHLITKPFDIDDLIDTVASMVPLEAAASQDGWVPSLVELGLAVAAATRARTAVLVLDMAGAERRVRRSKDVVFAVRGRLAELSPKLARRQRNRLFDYRVVRTGTD